VNLTSLHDLIPLAAPGTIAQVSTALDAAQRAAEAESITQLRALLARLTSCRHLLTLTSGSAFSPHCSRRLLSSSSFSLQTIARRVGEGHCQWQRLFDRERARLAVSSTGSCSGTDCSCGQQQRQQQQQQQHCYSSARSPVVPATATAIATANTQSLSLPLCASAATGTRRREREAAGGS
jgi:hypothetical protein